MKVLLFSNNDAPFGNERVFNEYIPHDALSDFTATEDWQIHHPENSSYGWA
jgi:hypothetical protein